MVSWAGNPFKRTSGAPVDLRDRVKNVAVSLKITSESVAPTKYPGVELLTPTENLSRNDEPRALAAVLTIVTAVDGHVEGM